MKKTCATCKHCIWDKRGGHKIMTCKESCGRKNRPVKGGEGDTGMATHETESSKEG